MRASTATRSRTTKRMRSFAAVEEGGIAMKSRLAAAAVIPGAQFVEIPSAMGHLAATNSLAAGAGRSFVAAEIGAFLAWVARVALRRQRLLPPCGERAEGQHRGRHARPARRPPARSARCPRGWADDLASREHGGEGGDPAGPQRRPRLWRTSAVVEATSDRNTAPNRRPEVNTASGCALSTGSNVASASSASGSPATGRPESAAACRPTATTRRRRRPRARRRTR